MSWKKLSAHFFVCAVSSCIVLGVCASTAFADRRGPGPSHSPRPQSPRPPVKVSPPRLPASVHHHPRPSSLWALPAIAETVRYLLAPPPGYVVVTYNGMQYYRHGHVYYRQIWRDGRWVYMEVAPPPGVIVTTLPPSPEKVYINGQVYYRDNGTYYIEAPAAATSTTTVVVPNSTTAQTTTNANTNTTIVVNPGTSESSNTPTTATKQFVVTKPPVGAVLDRLPDGATAFDVGGVTYFKSGDLHYLPISVGDGTKYVVVEPPK